MKPSTFRALNLLRSTEWITTHDLLEAGVGSRFGARIGELRHDFACAIHGEEIRAGSWRYRLLSEPFGLTVKAQPSDVWKAAERINRWDEHAAADTYMAAVFGSTERPGSHLVVTGVSSPMREERGNAVPETGLAPNVPVTTVESAASTSTMLAALPTPTAGTVAVQPHLRRIRPELPAEQLTLLEATA